MNNSFWRFKASFASWGALLLVVVLGCFSLQAEDDGIRYLQQIWQTEDGLPTGGVRAILQGKDGYLWAATPEGIVRFDGAQFETFGVKAANQGHFFSLAEGSDHSIWTSTGQGLERIEGAKTVLYTTNNGLPVGSVLTLYSDKSGALWVGTEQGLFRRDGEKFAQVEYRNGSSHDAIRAIVQDNKGVVWLGTSEGLIRCQGGKGVLQPSAVSLPAGVQCLCLSHDDGLWVGTTNGLARWQNERWTTYGAKEGEEPARDVHALYEDPTGVLWVGTADGVYRLTGGEFTPVVTSGEVSADFANTVPGNVYSIFGDREGDVWIGSDAVLNQLKKQSFRLFHKTDGLPSSRITSVLQSRNGDLWIGTVQGLGQWRAGKFINWATNAALAKSVRSLCEDSTGTLWMGIDNDGVFCLKDGRITAHFSSSQTPGFSETYVRAICQDGRGNLWLGGADSLIEYKQGKFVSFPESFPSVKTIVPRRAGGVWVGFKNGMAQVGAGRTILYGRNEGVPGMINAIAEDPVGNVWLGSESGRLLEFKDGKISFLPTHGLFSRVLEIVEGISSNLWISSDNGVFCLSESELNSGSRKNAATDSIFYSKLEGGQRIQLNGAAQPAGWKDRENHVWFPTLNGLMRVDTAGWTDSDLPPVVNIEQASIPNHTIAKGGSFSLPMRGGYLEFGFTALSLWSPGRILFKCKLDGLDRAWQDLGAARSVRYANLSPGKYIFRVKASNNEGVWNGQETDFPFTVTPHFYQTPLFYIFCFILFLAVVASGWRWAHEWRLRTLRQRDAEVFQLVDQWTKSLQQEVAERKQAQQALQESHALIMRQERLAAVGQLAAGLAHEFNNILTIIQGHACLLLDNPAMDEDSMKSVTHISDGVERTAKLIQQMLAFSRKQVMQQKALAIQETVVQISDMLGQLLGEHVMLQFEMASELPVIMADADMVQQIIVNLVVNARDAMSSGGSVIISGSERSFTAADLHGKAERRAGRFLKLSVSDTGSGMDTTIINHLFEPFFTTKDIGKGPGLGLATVFGMVNQHEGWIEVESKLGCGTTFNIYFPATDIVLEKPQPEIAPEGGKETVLVVEDEAVLRELVREILEVHGYQVLEACDGQEAFAIWEKNQDTIDLLLTDVAMPHGMSGRDLAAKIQAQNPRLPVLFSSGYSQEMLERHEQAGKGQSFLSKPYHPAELAQAVRDALDSATQIEPSLGAPSQ